MRLSQHPGYQSYCQDSETYLRFKQALIVWEAKTEPAVAQTNEVNWTPAQAREFIVAIAALFREYNLVLWERFPYCQRCGGLCCRASESHISLLDLLALALLDQPLPVLAEFIEASQRDCIYYTNHGCCWPEDWRPIKCWSFYCLGSGDWELDSRSIETYADITKALQKVVIDLLPKILHQYEIARDDLLAEHLGDPLDFAVAFREAALAVLLAPPLIGCLTNDCELSAGDFEQLFARERFISDRLIGESRTLAFIAKAIEQLYELSLTVREGPPGAADLLLADLELLEWIVINQPANTQALLIGMDLRYKRLPAHDSSLIGALWRQMHAQIMGLLRPAS